MRVAASLAEALAALSHPGWRPDIIVTDLHVPDSEGPRTLEALQAVAGEVPVVVCTGAPTEVLRGQLDALGAADLGERRHRLRPCLTSACTSDSTDEATEVGDEHHRLGHLR